MTHPSTPIILRGNIYTMNPEDPRPESLVLSGEKILASGSLEKMQNLFPQAFLVDCNSFTILPGFYDSHVHMLNFGRIRRNLLFEGCNSLEEMQKRTKEFLDKPENAKLSWIEARGWSEEKLGIPFRLLTRKDLDRICPSHPLVATRICGCMCTLNTKALRALGLFEKIPETIREGVDRDEKGMPSGVMRGPAETYVYKNMPPQGEAEVLQALEEAMKLYASSGITSVQSCDFGTFRVPFRTTLKAYKKLDRGKKLPLRVNLMAHLDTRESLEDFLSLSIRTGQGSDYCRMGPYKLQPDGSLGTWSARLRSPYQDKPESRGIWNHSEEEFFSLMYQAHHAGMQLVADAIGDACIDMVLNTYEKILGPQGGLQHRPGIDHCQITAPQQIERFRNLSIIAGLEFTFLPSDMPIIIRRIGEKRSKNSYNWKEFFLQNVPVAPGSDSPVEFWAPLWGIQAAVTRKKEGKTFLPEQRLSIEQALRSYTLGSAFASFEEHCKGSLRRGSFADLVLLREDPHRVSPEEIKDIPIGATITGGRVVYRNDSITPPELDLLRHP